MSEGTIHTGGAAVEGDVQAGRDFVGRDQITVNINWKALRFSLE